MTNIFEKLAAILIIFQADQSIPGSVEMPKQPGQDGTFEVDIPADSNKIPPNGGPGVIIVRDPNDLGDNKPIVILIRVTQSSQTTTTITTTSTITFVITSVSYQGPGKVDHFNLPQKKYVCLHENINLFISADFFSSQNPTQPFPGKYNPPVTFGANAEFVSDSPNLLNQLPKGSSKGTIVRFKSTKGNSITN